MLQSAASVREHHVSAHVVGALQSSCTAKSGRPQHPAGGSIFIHLFAFLCLDAFSISMHSMHLILCIHMHFLCISYAFRCISMHLQAFLCIFMHLHAFLCCMPFMHFCAVSVSMHFYAFICMLCIFMHLCIYRFMHLCIL
jgi:hypothetical protein